MPKILLAIGLVVVVGVVGLGVWKATQPPKPVLASDVAKIVNRGKLIVGTDATYPPMENVDKDGKIVGFDIDLVSEIAKQLGVSLEIKNILWDKLFGSLGAGEVDMAISSITITPERSKTWLFSRPYFASGQVIVVKSDNTSIKSPADLKDKKVSAQKDTTGETETLKYVADKQIERFISSWDVVVDKLKNKKLDALVIDYPAAQSIVETNPGLKIGAKPFTSEFYGIVFRKDSPGVLEAVDKIISDLKTSGKLKEIEQKWFK